MRRPCEMLENPLLSTYFTAAMTPREARSGTARAQVRGDLERLSSIELNRSLRHCGTPGHTAAATFPPTAFQVRIDDPNLPTGPTVCV
jgi:hypothetical protein